MNKGPLKKEARVLGIDDGPYVIGSRSTVIVMTVYRLDGHIDGFISGQVTTDGDDSASVIAGLLKNSKYYQQIRCIISDGACLAGFNVLDLDLLYELTGIPIITASDETPRSEEVEKALKQNFDDWSRRFDLITRHTPHEKYLPDGVCYIREKGISPNDADDIIERATVRGRTPEPIRLSHMVAAIIHKEKGR